MNIFIFYSQKTNIKSIENKKKMSEICIFNWYNRNMRKIVSKPCLTDNIHKDNKRCKQ